MSKERELTEEQKKGTITELSFLKGILVAVFAGVLSASFAYGLAAGKPIADLARASLLRHGRSELWQNLPVLIVVLAGGFTTNFVWCVFLNVKNRTAHQYLGLRRGAVSEAAPLFSNYLFSALAGVTWYLQFFFYSMGQTKMGKYESS